jgi:hypothetical protein
MQRGKEVSEKGEGWGGPKGAAKSKVDSVDIGGWRWENIQTKKQAAGT